MSSIAIMKMLERGFLFMFRLPRPQKNFIEVPKIVFDELIPNITNLAALKCYLILIRKTWGWEKIGDWLALSQLVDLTKLTRKSVTSGMKWLDEQGYIWIVKAGTPGKEKTMYFLCTEETEHLENSVKQGLLTPDTLYKMMMKERDEAGK